MTGCERRFGLSAAWAFGVRPEDRRRGADSPSNAAFGMLESRDPRGRSHVALARDPRGRSHVALARDPRRGGVVVVGGAGFFLTPACLAERWDAFLPDSARRVSPDLLTSGENDTDPDWEDLNIIADFLSWAKLVAFSNACTVSSSKCASRCQNSVFRVSYPTSTEKTMNFFLIQDEDY